MHRFHLKDIDFGEDDANLEVEISERGERQPVFLRAFYEHPHIDVTKYTRTKSKVRAKVEHCFGVIKRVFGFSKVRYRGLDKNANRLFVTCALANLFVVRRRLLRLQGA